jgi:hypothetical protein
VQRARGVQHAPVLGHDAQRRVAAVPDLDDLFLEIDRDQGGGDETLDRQELAYLAVHLGNDARERVALLGHAIERLCDRQCGQRGGKAVPRAVGEHHVKDAGRRVAGDHEVAAEEARGGGPVLKHRRVEKMMIGEPRDDVLRHPVLLVFGSAVGGEPRVAVLELSLHSQHARDRTHLGAQHRVADRLDEVIVRAAFEGADERCAVRRRAQEHDRDPAVARGGADLFGRFVAAHHRHGEVHQDDVGAHRRDGVHGFQPVGCSFDAIPHALQETCQENLRLRMIVDDEHRLGGCGLLRRCGHEQFSGSHDLHRIENMTPKLATSRISFTVPPQLSSDTGSERASACSFRRSSIPSAELSRYSTDCKSTSILRTAGSPRAAS